MEKKKDETTITMELDGKTSGPITMSDFKKLPGMIKNNMDRKAFDGLPGKTEEEQAFDELKDLTRTRQILSLKTDGDIFSVRYKETDRERVFSLSSRPANMGKLIEKMTEFRPVIWKLIGEKLDVTPSEINIGYDKYGVSTISVSAMVGVKGGEGQLRIKPNLSATFARGAVGIVKWAFGAIDSVIRSENAIRSQDSLPLE